MRNSFLDFLQFQKFLPTVGEIFVDFRQIFSDRVFKTVLHASRVTFWGTLVFFRKKLILDSTLLSRTSATFFGNSSEIFRVFGQKRQGCQNCIPFVRWRFCRKAIVFKSLIVDRKVWSFCNNLLDFHEKNPWNLLYLLSMCRQKHFDENPLPL